MAITPVQQQDLLAKAQALLGAIQALPVDTPPVIVPPPPASLTPNLPSGLSLISHYPFPDAIPAQQGDVALSDGWHSIYNGQGNGSASGGILQVKYPAGFAGGSAPCTLYRGLPAMKQLYASFQVKVSQPWQGQNANVNKLVYFFLGNLGSIPLVFYGLPGGPYHLRAFPQTTVSTDTWIFNPQEPAFPIDGNWHAIEFYADLGGTLAFSLDGAIQTEVTGLPMPTQVFTEFHLTPVWGGTGDTKAETDYLWFQNLSLYGA